MNFNYLAAALIAFSSLGVTACTRDETGSEEKTGWAGIADKARAEVREEMATQDLDIGKSGDELPGAALSPQGDLVIGGEKVAITEAQRELLLDYRARLADVAETGAEIGLQAAALATTAMKEAAMAALSGDEEGMKARMEAESAPIAAAAQALCDQLPALLASQRAAADAVPEFRPYATMDEKDIEDCEEKRQVSIP
ncbi:hypothetical protein [Arenimonas alkanexedens]